MGVIVPSPAGSTPMDQGAERVFTLLNQTTVTDATGTDFDVSSMAVARLTIVPVAYTGTITFYGSVDGTNFDLIRGYRQGSTSIPATNVALSSSSAATVWRFSVTALKKIRVITSGSSGTSISIVGRASPLEGTEPFLSIAPVAGKLATYTYALSATAPYATPTDWIVIRGSATKTVKIQRIEISGAATGATEVILALKKHTVANTAGTSTTPTPMQHDSLDAAATAVVLLYSVAPTIDATATIWKNVRLTLALAPAATTVNPDRFVYDYGVESYEPLTLRGVAQELAINFGGVAVPSGGVYDVAITFSED